MSATAPSNHRLNQFYQSNLQTTRRRQTLFVHLARTKRRVRACGPDNEALRKPTHPQRTSRRQSSSDPPAADLQKQIRAPPTARAECRSTLAAAAVLDT